MVGIKLQVDDPIRKHNNAVSALKRNWIHSGKFTRPCLKNLAGLNLGVAYSLQNNLP